MDSTVTLGDVVLAARYLMQFARVDQIEKCEVLFEQTQDAQRYLWVAGRVHALLGDGSLGSLALRKGVAAMPASLDQGALDALNVVITRLSKKPEPNASLPHM